jgi:chaperone required for assembly of F1-ATPase
MALPTEGLAELAALEWNSQAETIDFGTIPITQLAWRATDVLPSDVEDVVRRIVEYADHDLLCYFADSPAELVRRQEAAWTPLLQWAWQELGAGFRPTAGVAHVDQPPEALAAIEALALASTPFHLVGLDAAAHIFGSAILAFAVMKGRLGAMDAFAASQIDETFQAETWGTDAEASERRQAMAGEAINVGRWFQALA